MEYSRLAECYDTLLGEEATATWRAGILREIELIGFRSGRILDLGAGTGIGARLLRQKGDYHLTLLDKSQQMLDRAKQYADQLVLADMTAFSMPGKEFDLITSGFESINYLSPIQLPKMFAAVAKHLAMRSLFIFDYASSHFLEERCATKQYTQREQRFHLVWQHRRERDSKGIITRLSFFANNQKQPVWIEDHIQYALGVQAIHEAAEQSGLRVLNLRNFGGSVFSKEYKAHVFCLARS